MLYDTVALMEVTSAFMVGDGSLSCQSTARHRAGQVHSTLYILTDLKTILILSFHLRLHLPSVLQGAAEWTPTFLKVTGKGMVGVGRRGRCQQFGRVV